MAVPQEIHFYSPQEYYELERNADTKSEFYRGEIFAMAGSSTLHSLISTNVLIHLGALLKGKPCVPYNSDQRIKVLATGLRCYPDASVFCEPMEYDEEDPWKDTATNPTVLVEVLSDSTEAYDRGTKSAQFRLIPALKSYLLVSQNEARLELYDRQNDGSWRFTEVAGRDSELKIPTLGISLSLAEVYDRVEFARIRS